MVLVAHELLDLLLTALQFDHNLPVPLLDRLTVVALSAPAVIKGLLSVLLRLIVLRQLLRVKLLHLCVALFILLIGTFKGPLHFERLLVPM